jgi:hypothetical protein
MFVGQPLVVHGMGSKDMDSNTVFGGAVCQSNLVILPTPYLDFRPKQHAYDANSFSGLKGTEFELGSDQAIPLIFKVYRPK